MLVCNVSQLRRRAAILADVAEAAAALDAPGTGNVVFATLVDDPASVGEHVDAFLGQIMVEAASAAATVNTGLLYAVGIVEAASAIDSALAGRQMIAAVAETIVANSVQDAALMGISAAVVEAATAADAPDASVIAGVRFEGALALDGPIMPSTTQPTVIFIEG
jgi:hypothetical protein